MKALWVALKDLKLIARDGTTLLFTLIVPVMVISIVAKSLASESSGTIVLPVADEDGGPVAGVLIEALGDYVEVEQVTRDEARRRVQVDKSSAAALVLPEHLSKRYLGGRPSTLTLLTDPAKGMEIGVVKVYLLLADRDASALADPLQEDLLEVEEEAVTGTRQAIPTFEQVVPGFSLMFVLMSVLLGVAFGLREELDLGTVTRLRVAPVSRLSVLSGKLCARFLVGAAQMLVLFVFGHLVFGVSLGQSLPTFLLMTAAVVFSMTGFGLLVACFAGSREQIIPIGLTVVMVASAIGGCWWPIYQMPEWLQQAAHVFPTPWAIDGLHDLILRERGFSDVLSTLGVLFAYGTICLLAGSRIYRFA